MTLSKCTSVLTVLWFNIANAWYSCKDDTQTHTHMLFWLFLASETRNLPLYYVCIKPAQVCACVCGLILSGPHISEYLCKFMIPLLLMSFFNSLSNLLFLCVSQYRAVGGEDLESSGPASEGCQWLLWPLCEDLPTARQEEEIPDQGESLFDHTHLYLLRQTTVLTLWKQTNKKNPPNI